MSNVIPLMKVPGFEPHEAGASPEQIAGTERVLGVRFPSKYVELLASFGGSYGDAGFPIPGSSVVGSIGNWLSLSPWESESLWSMLASWGEHELPRSVVPIAADGGGNLVCLDYRVSEVPQIVLWFHELAGENGLMVVASSFTEFLESLLEPAV